MPDHVKISESKHKFTITIYMLAIWKPNGKKISVILFYILFLFVYYEEVM